jgi:hypothetical protein
VRVARFVTPKCAAMALSQEASVGVHTGWI